MLAPFPITRRLVMDPSQELKILNIYLRGFDAQLVVQLALRSSLHAPNSFGQFSATLARNAKRMRAACIGPHVGECNLLGRTLLEEQFIFGVE